MAPLMPRLLSKHLDPDQRSSSSQWMQPLANDPETWYTGLIAWNKPEFQVNNAGFLLMLSP